MGVKAVGIALKLTFEGMNQFIFFETWLFTVVVIGCCLTQINYLNKVCIYIYMCVCTDILEIEDTLPPDLEHVYAGFGHL